MLLRSVTARSVFVIGTLLQSATLIKRYYNLRQVLKTQKLSLHKCAKTFITQNAEIKTRSASTNLCCCPSLRHQHWGGITRNTINKRKQSSYFPFGIIEMTRLHYYHTARENKRPPF